MPDPATPRPVSPVPDRTVPDRTVPDRTVPDRTAGRRPLLRSIVGDVLRRIRLEQRRTLADVARAARVSMPYLSELERGRKEASSEVLAAICAALRIDLSDLLTEVGRELAIQRPAQVIRLDRARPGPARESRIAPPVSRPGDIQAQLAA